MLQTVAVDIRMITFSGIGVYIQNLLPYLIRKYSLVVLGNPSAMEQFPYLSETRFIPCTSGIYSLREHLELPRKAPAADVFWVPHFNMPFLPVPAHYKTVTIHDVYHLTFQQEFPLLQRLFARALILNAARRSHLIFTVSQFSKREIIRYTGVPENKIKVVYNGIDHHRFRVIKDKQQLQEISRRYQLPSRFILYVGNVKPHKNLKRLLQAFEKIATDFPDVHLIIVGKKEGFITEDTELLRLTGNNRTARDRIRLLGIIDLQDLPVLYNLATVFVFPSFYEGFGLPPLESMACGCPVVCSRAASLPEVGGEAVFYVNPLEVDSIAGGIRALIEDADLRQKLIRRGLKRAQLFTWDATAEQVIEILEKTFNQKSTN